MNDLLELMMINLNLSKSQIHGIILGLLILPPIITAIYINVFSVNVIYWDQWDFLRNVLSHFYEGNLSIQDLFSQHNEHRLFFPFLIMVIISAITSYNNQAEMLFSYILILINIVIIFKIYFFGKEISWKELFYFIPIPWLICSLHQGDSLLSGFNFQIFLSITSFLLTIVFFIYSKGLDWYFVGAILGGIISSFSFLIGLCVWPIGLLYILINEKNRSRSIQTGIWIIVSALTIILFFTGYNWPLGNSSMLNIFNNPLTSLLYFFLSLGSTLSFNIGEYGVISGIIGGILLFIITIYTIYLTYKLNLFQKNIHYVAIISFSLLSEIMLVIGRGGLGIEQGTSARYVSFLILVLVGVYCLFIQIKKNQNQNTLIKALFALICILIFLGIILSTIDGIEQGILIKNQREEMRDYLLSFQSAPDSSLNLLYPDPSVVREWAPFLKQNKLNVFSGS